MQKALAKIEPEPEHCRKNLACYLAKYSRGEAQSSLVPNQIPHVVEICTILLIVIVLVLGRLASLKNRGV